MRASIVPTTTRTQQVSALFDVPPTASRGERWQFAFEFPPVWSVGAIVGPSGSGKSTVAAELFPDEMAVPSAAWGEGAVIDAFAPGQSVEAIAAACSAVGFNTIPAWLRPFAVLSMGEQFRVTLARRLLEGGARVVMDEFTSVVDRQVAKIGSHAVQRYIRREGQGRQFVAVSCHYDILDWLQPDWVLDMATQRCDWRSVQRGPRGDAPRPPLGVRVGRLPRAAWDVFARYHYLTAELHRAATCYGLWCEGQLAAFAAVLHRPHPKAQDIKGFARVVTLPDWQGMGLNPRLTDTVAAAYAAFGWRMRSYPAHPAHIRVLDRSPTRRLIKRPGRYSSRHGSDGNVVMGGRPCAVFEFVGPPLPDADARRVLGDAAKRPSRAPARPRRASIAPARRGKGSA